MKKNRSYEDKRSGGYPELRVLFEIEEMRGVPTATPPSAETA